MKRYKELRFQDKIFTETYKINEILVKEGFEWFLDCEVENCRIEILKNTLVFNSGVFFNGTWVYGVFRDGQWKYGTWEGGVWYNGTWYNGIFKNGLIFGGRFIKGKIEGGEIRGGEFFDMEISKDVANNTVQKIEQKSKPQQGKPQNRGVQQKAQQPQQEEEPQIQPEKIEERVMRFKSFKMIKESKMAKKYPGKGVVYYNPNKFAAGMVDSDHRTDEEKIISFFIAYLGEDLTVTKVVRSDVFDDFCEKNLYDKNYVLNVIRNYLKK